MSKAPARAWIEVDRRALGDNVAALRQRLPAGCRLMPAVKANAYGHGAVLVAAELERLGVDAFCVATLSEGVQLRRGGVTGDILVLGYTEPDLAAALREYRLTQSIPDLDYGRALSRQGVPLTVQVKIDTGMHRLGEDAAHLHRLREMFSLPHLQVEGAYTHLCCATSRSPENRAVTEGQARRFESALAALEQAGCSCPQRHLLASYGLMNYPRLGGDLARVGIALYGVMSTLADSRACLVKLTPVLTLKARVAQVKDLARGQGAGYDLCFTARRPTRLAVLTIGYGDGVPRALAQGGGYVLLHGKKAPMVGRVCMDQLLLDVTDVPETRAGDVAVLLGQQGGQRLDACHWAAWADTIANDILSRLGERLERCYRPWEEA